MAVNERIEHNNKKVNLTTMIIELNIYLLLELS